MLRSTPCNSRRRVSICLAALFMLLVAAPASAQSWAEKMFGEMTHDFGTVARGADVVYKFPIRNIYEEDIELSSIRSSCGCTIPSLENKLLKTGEVGYVVAQFNTRAFTGSRSATLTVMTAFIGKDGTKSHAEVQLRVHGTIRSDIVFHPGSAKFENIDQGNEEERKISVTYAGRQDWKITDIRSANEHVEVEMVPKERQFGRVSYDLVVRLKEGAPPGFLKDQIVLVTNDHNNMRIPLDIEGRIVPEISVSPENLVLGEVAKDKSVTKRLVVKGKKPFKITAVECADGGCFTFKADEDSKALHVVQVTFDACNAPEGKMKQAIRIATDRGKDIGAVLTAHATVVKSEEPEDEKTDAPADDSSFKSTPKTEVGEAPATGALTAEN